MGINLSKYRFALYDGDGQLYGENQPIHNLRHYFDEYTINQIMQMAKNKMNSTGYDIAYFSLYGIAVFKKTYKR